MISDEDLQCIASVDDCYMGVHLGDMAKELLAQRKVREGWKMVPVEPTDSMINAALKIGCLTIRSTYSSMLAAAPEVEE